MTATHTMMSTDLPCCRGMEMPTRGCTHLPLASTAPMSWASCSCHGTRSYPIVGASSTAREPMDLS
nr:MAG TPA: hypothetical protein [Bacteriophage sp.]